MTQPLLANVVAPVPNGGAVEIINGLCYGVIEETIDLSGAAAASFPLTESLPNGCIPVLAQLKLNGTISAATAVKVGLGKANSTADPDKYAISSNLTAQTAGGVLATSKLAAQDTLAVFACATDGTAAGTIGGGEGETASVRLVYLFAGDY